MPRWGHTVRKVTDRTLGELYRRDGALEGGLAQHRAALTATDSSGILYCEAHAQGSGCPPSLFLVLRVAEASGPRGRSRPLSRAAELGVIGAGLLLPLRLIAALERDAHHLVQAHIPFVSQPEQL